MADTTVTPTALVLDTASATLAIAGGEAINAANTMSIVYPREGKLELILNNTDAAAKVVTVAHGDAVGSGVGDMEISLAQNEVKYVVLSSARFKTFGVGTSGGGEITLSFEAGTTGFVRAITVP